MTNESLHRFFDMELTDAEEFGELIKNNDMSYFEYHKNVAESYSDFIEYYKENYKYYDIEKTLKEQKLRLFAEQDWSDNIYYKEIPVLNIIFSEKEFLGKIKEYLLKDYPTEFKNRKSCTFLERLTYGLDFLDYESDIDEMSSIIKILIDKNIFNDNLKQTEKFVLSLNSEKRLPLLKLVLESNINIDNFQCNIALKIAKHFSYFDNETIRIDLLSHFLHSGYDIFKQDNTKDIKNFQDKPENMFNNIFMSPLNPSSPIRENVENLYKELIHYLVKSKDNVSKKDLIEESLINYFTLEHNILDKIEKNIFNILQNFEIEEQKILLYSEKKENKIAELMNHPLLSFIVKEASESDLDNIINLDFYKKTREHLFAEIINNFPTLNYFEGQKENKLSAIKFICFMLEKNYISNRDMKILTNIFDNVLSVMSPEIDSEKLRILNSIVEQGIVRNTLKETVSNKKVSRI